MALTPVSISSIASSSSIPVSSTGSQQIAVSEVSIWNEALSVIGARSRISSPLENSPQAHECALRYVSVRDSLLRSAPWDFAERTIPGGLLKAAPGTPENQSTGGAWQTDWPPPPWLYMYLYPNDAVRVLRLKPQPYSNFGGPRTYRVVFKKAADLHDSKLRTVILTNEPEALIVYTARVENPTLFDPLFKEALIVALAAELAIPLTGAIQLAGQLAQKANGLINQARVSDGNEGLTTYDHVPDWLQVRGVGGMVTDDGIYAEPYGPLFGGK